MVTRVRPARAGAASPRRPARRACSGPASSSRCGRAPHAAPRRPAPRPAAAFGNAFVRCRAPARSPEQPGVTIHNYVLILQAECSVCTPALTNKCVLSPPRVLRMRSTYARFLFGWRLPRTRVLVAGVQRTAGGVLGRHVARPGVHHDAAGALAAQAYRETRAALLHPSYTCMRYHSSSFPLPSHLFHTPLYHVPHAHPKLPRLP